MNLKTLSEHLKLSQTTVSRALNGYPEVSEKTRMRVQQAAQELNYSPNARAKGLATGRAQTIGHVIPVSTQHEMVNPVFGDFIAGAGSAYAAAGFEMMISLVDDKSQEKLYRDICARRNVDGIIVHGPTMDDPRIALLSELNMPFVVHGRASNIDLPYSWLDTNNSRAFQRATEFLLDLGHTRIALMNGLEFMDYANRRRLAYEGALTGRGIALDGDLMCSKEMTEIKGFLSASAMLKLESPPTAFLTSSMITAIGVRRAIHDAGLTLGKDVSVITHDDDLGYLKNGHDVPIFTATRSSVREAGIRAGEILLRLIRDPSAGPIHEIIEAELIIGASTGPAPRRQNA
ncbi:LacI family DNA-binding transcriptional regulator [Pelagimonas varians]|uniref:Putative HTH-type transcriptional repressor ExuR n=1 Tax=Pelagimonas varians TaxID=696760 RepID=A0A238KYX0_9RHOB|nr:substrate-binding domain-containing protein [Pelagimonas varians]PYG27600.1 LacI family transcriptional regulator [Pelagimonas varians]SMX47888.1 putative HTH-type transcriptional repressor ExuR [Pelagimonas varians]